MSSSSSLAKEVLLSLPPMDKIDLGSVKTAIKTLPGYHESDLEAWKEFQCLETTKSKAASGALADALVTELQKYQEKHYCCGGSGGGGGGATKATIARHSVTKSDTNNLRIRTYAELLEPHKFMAGYWASDWILHHNAAKGVRKLTGTITVHVHYYEDITNVQFRASREVPEFCSDGNSNDNDAAAAIVQHMIRSLDKLHVDLMALCDDQVQASLRKVRRILPITKTRMKWDDAAQEAVRLLTAEKGTLKKKKNSPFHRNTTTTTTSTSVKK